MADRNSTFDWNTEDEYWRQNYRTRPYATSGNYDYDYYRPGYRFGVESASRYSGRKWEEAESDLRRDWDRYEHRGESTWEHIKSAVRDAWDRVTGKTPAMTR